DEPAAERTDPIPTIASPSPGATPAPSNTPAQPAELTGEPRLEKLGSFNRPTYVISPPGDKRIFVVEQDGRVVEATGGGAKTPAFIDIRNQVGCCGERGLFSIAFAPDYAQSGRAYLSYTNRQGDSRIDEYQVDPGNPDRLDPATRREILAVDQPFSNHNGDLIAFDPTGMLMIGFGDGGSGGDPGNRAQNLNTLLGKLLRIDPARPSGNRPYGIPEDNPFVGRSGARPEIWAYGLRNPWRWSFDPDTRDFYVADVGQNSVEEISFVPPAGQSGANYGWRKYEGNEEFEEDDRIDESRLVRPILTYPNSSGNCSVTGGGVYRGRVTQLRGFYLFADYCAGVVRGFKVQGGRAVETRTFAELNTSNLSSFGVDSQGDMYLTSLGGDVYRITAG
ncbi:MAG TPA: PQQ-dependent sugar dehydrogenase, partial [Actinomycetota bacterium]|nr:PQQ-dependent sugar dehydrogenase [Actinomycetota bacterium]